MQSLVHGPVHGPVQVFPCVSLFVYYSTIEGGATDSVITEEDVAALDLLIAGSAESADKNGVCSVLSLATLQSELSRCGYSKVSIQ